MNKCMHMANVTVSLPDDLKRKMQELNYVNWSAVIRNVIEEKLNDFELVDRIAKRSKLTVKDVEELSKRVDEDVRQEVRRLLHESNRRR